MSSLLNVCVSSESEEFSLKYIEVLVDSRDQNWFKRVHVGKFLGIENIRTSVNDLEKCEMLTRQELVAVRRPALDLSISKTRWIKSSQSLGSCISLSFGGSKTTC